ncbi:MAG: hypothetical protein ACPG4T_02040, partial [Nannocystaceae bacterium]
MWILLGNRERTRPVEGGTTIKRPCPECKQTAVFREHRLIKTLQLYTLGIANYGGKHLMVCGHCGEGFVTDEVATAKDPAIDQTGTLWGGTRKLAGEARQAAVAAGIPQSLKRARETVERGTTSSTQSARESARRLGSEVRTG